MADLLSLADASTRGDPESPLLWTCKSTQKLATELQGQGHQVSQQTVWRLLEKLDYSLQSNRKVHEGADEVDRDEQFLHIAALVKQFHRHHQPSTHQPVISVDAKKKELIGEFKNTGE